MMPRWEISDGYKLPKALKNPKGNAPVLHSYARLIEKMKSCDNPSVFGERKHVIGELENGSIRGQY